MRPFNDADGQAWFVAIHVTSIKRVKALTGVDLPRLIDHGMKGLGELLADPVQLVDVLFALCLDQAKERGISDLDFGAMMHGDTIGRAAEAFLDEYRDFFPDPRVRKTIGAILDKSRRLGDRAFAQVLTAIDALDDLSRAPTSTS